jgi:hypothetical protein
MIHHCKDIASDKCFPYRRYDLWINFVVKGLKYNNSTNMNKRSGLLLAISIYMAICSRTNSHSGKGRIGEITLSLVKEKTVVCKYK